MTSQDITLQDKIDSMKKKKEQENESKNDYESKKNKELEQSIETLDHNVKYLTELIESNQSLVHETEKTPLGISTEPFKTLNKNDKLIYKKVKNFGAGVHNELVELHQKSLNDSISRLEKNIGNMKKRLIKF